VRRRPQALEETGDGIVACAAATKVALSARFGYKAVAAPPREITAVDESSKPRSRRRSAKSAPQRPSPPQASRSGSPPREVAALLPDFDARYERSQGAITVLMTDFLMAHLRAVFTAFDGDLHAALVLGEIGHTTTRRFTEAARHDAIDLRQIDRADIAAVARPCNALSVSLATGMPRETVRRKVRWLAERGWIVRAKGGWVATAAAGQHFMPDFNRVTARRLLETAQRMLDVLDAAG
jgi:hypothetical protein